MSAIFPVILDTVLPIAATGLLGWLTVTANGFLAQHKMSAAQDDLDQALQHGAALALSWFHSLENHNASLAIPEGMMAEIVAHVMSLAPTAVKVLGITPVTIEALVQAAFGAAFHTALIPGAAAVMPLQPAAQQY